MQPLWSSQQLLHGWSQLIAVGKQLSSAKDVEAQPGPGEGYYKPPHIPDVPHCPCAYQRQQDIVILLALVLIHRGNLQQVEPQNELGLTLNNWSTTLE